MLNSTKTNFTIDCNSNELAEIVLKGLEPENSLLDEKTKISMRRDGKIVEITIESFVDISSIRYTLDDILHTVSTIEKVFLSTNKL